MARPDGRAFCALWAQSRRAAAHSGGPRPSRPASASLRPRSGRGPSGGPRGPGLGPALPTRRPRGLVLLAARQGDASPAGWWGLPSAPSGRVPPAPSGPRAATPCPPWAAWAPPAPPACGGRGVVAAGRRLRRLRSAPLRGLPAASRCAGPPSRAARPSPLRGPLRGPCPPPAPRRLRRRCSGPPRPHSWGLLGRCGPPARACLAPASRLAAALPTLGPPGVAAPPRCGVPPPSRGAASAPSGRVPCAAAI